MNRPGRFPQPFDRHAKFQLLVCFLVASLASLSALPFVSPWGADLHNLQVYQQCAKGQSPYLVSGQACGDLFGRPLIYPPLLFHSFSWLRSISLAAAMRIWTAFHFAAFAVLFYVWVRKIAREPRDPTDYEIPVFCGLLLFQYPFVFALERGGTDVGTVVLGTLTAYLFSRERSFWAGSVAGVSCAYKLYPLISVGIIVATLFWARADERKGENNERWTWLRFGAGATLAFLACNLIWWNDARLYFGKVLPYFLEFASGPSEYSHSVPAFVGAGFPLFPFILCAGLAAVWCWAGRRALQRGEGAIFFAGALAVSTYWSKTSYDYNLSTTYPLLLLLFLRARRTNRFASLAFGLFAIVGDRRLFKSGDVFTPQLHLTLQLAFLTMAAISIGRQQPPEMPLAPQAAR